jgi:hypothetical protein
LTVAALTFNSVGQVASASHLSALSRRMDRINIPPLTGLAGAFLVISLTALHLHRLRLAAEEAGGSSSVQSGTQQQAQTAPVQTAPLLPVQTAPLLHVPVQIAPLPPPPGNTHAMHHLGPWHRGPSAELNSHLQEPNAWPRLIETFQAMGPTANQDSLRAAGHVLSHQHDEREHAELGMKVDLKQNMGSIIDVKPLLGAFVGYVTAVDPTIYIIF